MKYSTKLIYGIDAKVLANMRHVDALRACQAGAKERLQKLTAPKLATWGYRRCTLVAYIEKSLNWIEEKLKEME